MARLTVEALSTVAVIIPVLNDATALERCLAVLQPLRQQGLEVIVVDGGSNDDSAALAGPLADQVLISEPGRAVQMNSGARATQREWLVFLHADTHLPAEFPNVVLAWRYGRVSWGYFALRLSGRGIPLRIVEWCINQRSYLTGVGTGDQCLFVRRALFEQVGGYPPIALMEDLTLCKLLRKHSRPLWVSRAVSTSSRRWEERGVLSTVWLMWRLRLAYFLGADPATLAEKYYGSR